MTVKFAKESQVIQPVNNGFVWSGRTNDDGGAIPLERFRKTTAAKMLVSFVLHETPVVVAE